MASPDVALRRLTHAPEGTPTNRAVWIQSFGSPFRRFAQGMAVHDQATVGPQLSSIDTLSRAMHESNKGGNKCHRNSGIKSPILGYMAVRRLNG